MPERAPVPAGQGQPGAEASMGETLQRLIEKYDDSSVSVAHVLCDRHDAERPAFTFVEADQTSHDVTYGELARRSARMASLLADHGVTRGSKVAVLMGKRPELVVTLLAIWRLGAVHVPLFTAFAAGAIEMRVRGSEADVVVSEPSQSAKLSSIAGVQILEVGEQLDRQLAEMEPLSAAVALGPQDPIVLLFTSGTTGSPKGVPVPVRALAAFEAYMHYGLDVSADDVYWNAADPGWAYGLYYAVIGPLVTGRRNLLLNAPFTADSTIATMRAHGVTNFAGAPTMYRALSKSGIATDVRLRRASSAGEPLTPDVLEWSVAALGVEVRDHYGQTEVGMVAGNAWQEDARRPVKPGSMGRALPGFAVDVRDGQIAIDVENSPLFWFAGYLDNPEASAERFTDDGRWYLTGDTGTVDEDGYLTFRAREDDVILAAGYRIGPVDVESVLIADVRVADVAVVGVPDPDGVRGDIVKAFVVAADDVTPGDELAEELRVLVRDRYSAHAYPRAIEFVDSLPKTPSGKLQRFLLRKPDAARR